MAESGQAFRAVLGEGSKMSVVQMKTLQSLVPVDGDIWDRVDLSFRARALYLYLSRFHGVLPRVDYVQAVTGLGRDARRAAYAELRDAGLLVTRFGTCSHLPKGDAS